MDDWGIKLRNYNYQLMLHIIYESWKKNLNFKTVRIVNFSKLTPLFQMYPRDLNSCYKDLALAFVETQLKAFVETQWNKCVQLSK